MHRISAAGLSILFAFASGSMANPGLKLDKKDIGPKQCIATGAKQLVDVHFTLLNDADSGFNTPSAWANDTINRHLRIWQLADNTFCAQISDHGSFVTYAGRSPGATNTQLEAGITGTLEGGYITTDIVGNFTASSYPTHGDLGSFDLMCDQAFNCPGAQPPSWRDYFSAGVTGNASAQWGWIYRAGNHGTWLNEDDVAAEDSGDITTAPANPAEVDGGKVIFDSTIRPLPGNLPSVGAEAYSFTEFGDGVTFAGDSRALKSVTVTLSSWGCQSGHWYSGDCVSDKHATFSLPITINIYDPGDTVNPIATQTRSFDVPYRPSADTHCTGGRWFDHHQGCYNGQAANVTFDFKLQNVVLPNTIVYGISYNTTHYGPSPIGEGASCYSSSGGCPYDSLNIGLAQFVRVGSKPHPDTVWQNAAYGSDYCDGGSAGVGFLRLDSASSACWVGYVPAVQFNAGK